MVDTSNEIWHAWELKVRNEGLVWGAGRIGLLVAFGREWVCIQEALLLCAILAFFRAAQMRPTGTPAPNGVDAVD